MNKSLLASAIALSFTAGSLNSVYAAQENTAIEQTEIIEVTGIRGSVIKSLNNKRFSKDIIDTISAEDIGKFPDSNIAESLQRVTGVSIDRDGGEGRSITIRGLGPSFALTTFNGRMIASDTPSRSFSFDTLASEMIRSVDVYKTQSAPLTEGGIGGLVDISTAKPFDYDGRQLVFSAVAQQNQSSGETDPRLAFTYSDYFNDNKSGFLFAVNHHKGVEEIGQVGNFQWLPADQDKDGGLPHANLGRFPGPVNWHGGAKANQIMPENTFRPQGLDRGVARETRERTTFNTAFQHEVNDNMVITVDALYSEFNVENLSEKAGNWFWRPVTNYDYDGNSLTPEQHAAYFNAIPGWARNGAGSVEEFFAIDPDTGLSPYSQFHSHSDVPMHVIDENGTMTTMAHASNALASSNNRNIRDSDMTVLGFNMDWQINEKLSFVGDVFYSNANNNAGGKNRNITVENASASGWVAYDNSDGAIVPKIANFTSDNVDVNDFQIAHVQNQGNDIEAENIGLKLDFEYELDMSLLTSLQFGAHFARNSKARQEYEEDSLGQDFYKLNVQGFNDALPGNNNNFIRVTLAETLGEGQDISDFFTQSNLGLGLGIDDTFVRINADPYLAHITSQSTIDYLEAKQHPGALAAYLAANGGHASLWDLFNAKGGYNPHIQNDTFEIEEETQSLYANVNFETEISGMALTGMMGLRYVETKINSIGAIRKLLDGNFTLSEQSQEPGGDSTPATSSLIFSDTDFYAVHETNDYSNVLPNLNLNLNVTDELVARLAWTKSMTRPELEDIAPFHDFGSDPKFSGVGSGLNDLNENGIVDDGEVSGITLNSTGGNPNLEPYESTNFDLSLEWYYSDDSALTVAYFEKEIDGWITNQNNAEDYQFASYTSGIQMFVDRPHNIDTTDVEGWEVNWQHTLDSGFGWQANFSTVDSNAVLGLDSNFSLEGLSDSRNLIAFYEKNGFQVRVAYNYRDNFLQNIQDPSSNLANPEPQYVAEYEQVDVSASYRINKHFTVLLQGINVTDEATHKHGRYSNQFLEYTQTGPRYRLGVRGRF